MSSYNSDSSADEDSQQEYTYRKYGKIDPEVKLRVIRAIDKGLPKDKIAKKYAVHLPTIDYIYKQRDMLLKKFEQDNSANAGISYTNINELLLGWFVIQTRKGISVDEEQLKEKALEIAPQLESVDDWLLDFRMRNNILKHLPQMAAIPKADEKWIMLTEEHAQDLYIGGICALSHSLDLKSYLQKKPVDKFISIFYVVKITGLDKMKLEVIGPDPLQAPHIKSHPCNFYCCKKPTFTYSMLTEYLYKWNSKLKSEGKSIIFAVDMPDDILRNISLDNIKLVSISENNFVMKSIQKITECLKFNYRKIQAIKNIAYQKSHFNTVDYLDVLSAAWHSVPQEYIRRMVYPLKEGVLYFKTNEDLDNFSLSQWCEKYNILLGTQFDPKFMDQFVSCDEHLKCLDLSDSSESCKLESEISPLNKTKLSSTAGIDAYQAMKRIVSYLQGETFDLSLINTAKSLENYTEIGALTDMKAAISDMNEM